MEYAIYWYATNKFMSTNSPFPSKAICFKDLNMQWTNVIGLRKEAMQPKVRECNVFYHRQKRRKIGTIYLCDAKSLG